MNSEFFLFDLFSAILENLCHLCSTADFVLRPSFGIGALTTPCFVPYFSKPKNPCQDSWLSAFWLSIGQEKQKTPKKR